MVKRSMRNVSAAIDIGPSLVSMQIAQTAKDRLDPLEILEYPVNLGHDAFYDGKIEYENIMELTEIISKYQECLSAYPVGRCRVISCAAMRNADNSKIVRDILKTRQGIDVEILEENEEKALLYFEAVRIIKESDAELAENFIIAYIGSGSISMAVFQKGQITHTHNIPAGALKIHEILSGLRRESEDFYEVIREYVGGMLPSLTGFSKPPENIVLIGPEIERIAELTGKKRSHDVHVIDAGRLKELYKSLRSMTLENIMLKYEISEDDAAMMYYSLFYSVGLMNRIPVEIIAPKTNILTAVMREMNVPGYRKEFTEFKRSGAASCAEAIVSGWQGKSLETARLMYISCRLFEKLQKYHGMEGSWKTVLKMAASFAGALPFWGFNNKAEDICGLIRTIELFGLSRSEITVLALVTAFMETPRSIQENEIFKRLSTDLQLTVLKLSAVMAVAYALCTRNLQDIRFTLHEKHRTISITVSADTGALLEKWKFQRCQEFFRDIFGIEPVLSVKLRMLES